jgi:hypothetical protein
MDNLEAFLSDNDARMAFSLLQRLRISRGATVCLPDDMAFRYASEVLDISLETILESEHFEQILQHWVNPSGFPKGRDEENRETIDGLAVLAAKKFNGVMYKILDGILARAGDLDLLISLGHGQSGQLNQNVENWLLLPNDLFIETVRSTRVKGQELLTLCNSNRRFSVKCDASNQLLFRDALRDEFGIERSQNPRAKYTAIYTDYRVLTKLLDRIQVWSKITEIMSNFPYVPISVYELLYDLSSSNVHFLNKAILSNTKLYGLLDGGLHRDGLQSRNRAVGGAVGNGYYILARRYNQSTMVHGQKVLVGQRMNLETHARLSGVPEDTIIEESRGNYPFEEVAMWLRTYPQLFQQEALPIFTALTRSQLHDIIVERVQKLRDKAETLYRVRKFKKFMKREHVDAITLTEQEIDLLIKIHQSVMNSSIDISYALNMDMIAHLSE